MVSTGISVKIPSGYYGRIAMRSGLAKNQHLSVSAGVIDSDYRGAIGVLVYCTRFLTYSDAAQNYDPVVLPHSYEIKAGERFAQLVIEKIHEGNAVTVD